MSKAFEANEEKDGLEEIDIDALLDAAPDEEEIREMANRHK